MSKVRFGLRQDRRATVTVLVALSSIVLMGFLGLVIDLGNLNDSRRRLQGTADLAAVAAASNLGLPTTAADAVAVDNGYAAGAVTAVVTGLYTPDVTLPVAQRFVPSRSGVNAVQVSMSAPQAFVLSNIYNLLGQGGMASSASVGAQATAVNVVQGSFTIGSALTTFNGGIINGVLGGLFGTNISLSVADYQALTSGQVDLFQFSNALASELNVTGDTYAQLLSGSVTVGQFVQALQIAGAGTIASSALSDLVGALGASTQTINLSQLLTLGYFMNDQVGTATGMTAAISASQLVSLAGQVAGGGKQIALNLTTGIPGIAAVTGLMTVGEPPLGTTMITVGSAGATVHTAQTRLLLSVTLGSTLLGASVQLPLYLELGAATATLSAISCNALDPSNATASLAVTPSLASLWIGSVSAAAMSNFSAEPSPGPALLVNLSVFGIGLVSVNGYATAQMTNLQPTILTFTATDVQNDTMQATNTQDYFASLFATALGRLQLSATLLGIPVAVPAAASQLGGILAAASSPVDQLVTGLLQSLGIGLGVADAWVGGLHCAPAVLAQ